MTTEHQLERAVALCIDIMNRFHDGPRSPLKSASMTLAVQSVANWVSGLGLEPGQGDELMLRRVEAALLSRYGHELGCRLHGEFLGAFDGRWANDPPTDLPGGLPDGGDAMSGR